MTDHDAMREALASDPFAQQIAAEEAVGEYVERNAAAQAISGMDAVEQWAKITGIKVNNSAKETPKAPPAVPELGFYQASSLYGKQIERTRMIVNRMVPCGLTVLAGAPKRGKSWLALALSIAVASGHDFLGQKVQRGDVLYLDLESRQYRVQDRLSHLISGPAPDGLYVAHNVEPLGPRFYQQMEGWIEKAKAPALIIIDTLGRVKARGAKGENAYESDTRQYGALQSWAVEHKVGVVVVHHLRKVKDSDDWFDKINGSNGLVGAADAVLGLGGSRGDEVSKLMVSGRDIDGDYEMAIRFANGKWILESSDNAQYEEEQAYLNSPLIRGIFVLMYERKEWQGTATQLMDDIVEATQEPLGSYTVAAIGKELQRFSKILYEQDGILHGFKRTSQRRLMFFKNTRLKDEPSFLDGLT